MKNSDLKVIAIIVTIALFFTIVTSNAVSIASVVLLATGGISTNAGDEGAAGGTTTGGTTTGGTTTGGTTTGGTTTGGTTTGGTTTGGTTTGGTTTGGTTTGGTTTGGTTTGGGTTPATPSGDNGSSQQDKPQADKPGEEQGGENAGDVWDTAKCFNFYKAACDEILNGGIAGHTRKEWQEIQDFKLGSGAGGDALLGIIQGFVTGEADAGESVSEKGSDDAKRRMAPCGATLDYVASATKQDQGDNYVITIVMNDEITPAKGSAGIASMSTGILYMEDVVDTIQNDSTVSALVKGLTDDSKITYKAYTITATMTKDGHFIDINHITTGEIVAGAKLLLGSISGSGVLVFHSHWYDFKY